MTNYLIVSLGAAIGGAGRYWLSNFVYKFLPSNFPYGTLTVNIIGSFILGIIIYFFDSRELISPGLRLFLTIGFCGGFTTFSTFSFETINLIRNAEYLYAALNILSSVILCLLVVFLASAISNR
jgi:CrcB protein